MTRRHRPLGTPTTLCRNCGQRKGVAGRGLCLPCWSDVETRNRYPSERRRRGRLCHVVVTDTRGAERIMDTCFEAQAARLAALYRRYLEGIAAVRVDLAAGPGLATGGPGP